MPQIHNLERLKQERHNIEVNNLEMYKQEDLKEQCHEILIIFLLKRFNLGPIRTDKNGFVNLFVFAKTARIWSQSSKIVCPRSHWLRRHETFSLDTEDFTFLNYGFWVCKHNLIPFFCLIVPLNLWEGFKVFPKFSK